MLKYQYNNNFIKRELIKIGMSEQKPAEQNIRPA